MKNILSVILYCVVADVFALGCNVHTWHNVSAKEGTWKLNLQVISQQGYFVDETCHEIKTKDITKEQPLKYGFGFAKDADFNIAYTLTAVNEDKGFQSKACVFVISATGPAQPEIKVLNYHGANCLWNLVPGTGEDFIIQ
ncbi:hypothetical protein E3983_08810 [Legionella israelensis]|uniref:Uncharacterized protein n=1 Tax=Legionella israelensis TaxID=454 RepID=A0AAX1EH96_9GAMM|nr:hypothetical protein [Legionella israelensis]QBR84451.1 hypothetical protein E3983_08810 [Legionella israelensis]